MIARGRAFLSPLPRAFYGFRGQHGRFVACGGPRWIHPSPLAPAQLLQAAWFGSGPNRMPVKALLREVYKRVHPDRFHSNMAARTVNARSFQVLQDYLQEHVFGTESPQQMGRAQEYKLVFYLHKENSEEEETSAADDQADDDPDELFDKCEVSLVSSRTSQGTTTMEKLAQWERMQNSLHRLSTCVGVSIPEGTVFVIGKDGQGGLQISDAEVERYRRVQSLSAELGGLRLQSDRIRSVFSTHQRLVTALCVRLGISTVDFITQGGIEAGRLSVYDVHRSRELVRTCSNCSPGGAPAKTYASANFWCLQCQNRLLQRIVDAVDRAFPGSDEEKAEGFDLSQAVSFLLGRSRRVVDDGSADREKQFAATFSPDRSTIFPSLLGRGVPLYVYCEAEGNDSLCYTDMHGRLFLSANAPPSAWTDFFSGTVKAEADRLKTTTSFNQRILTLEREVSAAVGAARLRSSCPQVHYSGKYFKALQSWSGAKSATEALPASPYSKFIELFVGIPGSPERVQVVGQFVQIAVPCDTPVRAFHAALTSHMAEAISKAEQLAPLHDHSMQLQREACNVFRLKGLGSTDDVGAEEMIVFCSRLLRDWKQLIPSVAGMRVLVSQRLPDADALSSPFWVHPWTGDLVIPWQSVL